MATRLAGSGGTTEDYNNLDGTLPDCNLPSPLQKQLVVMLLHHSPQNLYKCPPASVCWFQTITLSS